jgi:Domain of unknown function (DUF1963)
MDRNTKTFDIIRFTGDKTRYYGASIEMPDILLQYGNYKKHTEVDIPLGHSRYGGPVLDLPPGFVQPDGFRFAAQLDLSQFAPFDKHHLLPQSGHIFVFADIIHDTGKVIFADIPTADLVRHFVEHDDNFYSGMCVDQVYPDTESLSERLRDPQDEEEKAYANADGKIWDYFAGSEKSKVFGIFTHCQVPQEGIEAITFGDRVVLLQVGENDFNDSGVFSVLIPRQDLLDRNFDNCEFAWSQS